MSKYNEVQSFEIGERLAKFLKFFHYFYLHRHISIAKYVKGFCVGFEFMERLKTDETMEKTPNFKSTTETVEDPALTQQKVIFHKLIVSSRNENEDLIESYKELLDLASRYDKDQLADFLDLAEVFVNDTKDFCDQLNAVFKDYNRKYATLYDENTEQVQTLSSSLSNSFVGNGTNSDGKTNC